MAAMNFSIKKWVAWAPGISTQQDWIRWQRGELLLPGNTSPDVSFLPPMQRRRLSAMARAAFFTSHACTDDGPDHSAQTPSVIVSCHGEMDRTFALLGSIARDDSVSPMAFSLSVHNAIAGQLSIATGNQQAFTAVAQGESGYLAGLWEALGFLQYHTNVLLTYVDAPLPEPYQPYCASPEFLISVSLLLGHDRGRACTLAEVGESQGSPETEADYLAIVDLLLKESGSLSCHYRGRRWQWSIHP